MPDLTKFAELMKNFIELFDRMIPLEQEKLEVVKQNQVSKLEELIKKEQAEVMALRGLDQKREAMQKELGFEGMTFQEILGKLPEQESAGMKELFDALGERVGSFQRITESSKTLMEVNLHAINKAVAKKQYGDNVRTYEEDGSVRSETAHFTDRRI